MPPVSAAAAAALSGFLATLVEAVEALTIVLAAGVARGWASALAGAGSAILLLAGGLFLFGPALLLVPIGIARVGIGLLLLAFGLRWLRKAVRRAAGRLRLRDEAAIYAATQTRLAAPRRRPFDRAGFLSAFSIVLVEGVEVLFILLALTAAHRAMLAPAGFGAVVALLLVVCIGAVLRRPLSMVPENLIKLGAGTLLASIGLFLLAEGLGHPLPGGDAALPVLVLLVGSLVWGAIRLLA